MTDKTTETQASDRYAHLHKRLDELQAVKVQMEKALDVTRVDLELHRRDVGHPTVRGMIEMFREVLTGRVDGINQEIYAHSIPLGYIQPVEEKELLAISSISSRLRDFKEEIAFLGLRIDDDGAADPTVSTAAMVTIESAWPTVRDELMRRGEKAGIGRQTLEDCVELWRDVVVGTLPPHRGAGTT